MSKGSDIYITITDQPYSQNGDGGSNLGANNQSSSTKSGSSGKNAVSIIKHQFFNFVESQAKQFISYSIGNIGNFTGNYQTQRQMQEALRIGNMAKNIGMAAISGLTMTGGNPIGALVVAGIATASTAINLIYEDYSLTIQTKQQNREISMMRKISGLDALDNGSRWGT